jgi:predicted metal-binding protein
MDKRIFKKCPTLGEYHGMALPYVKSQEEYREFYNQHKEIIDMEAKVYSEINGDRKKMGGDDKIHKI